MTTIVLNTLILPLSALLATPVSATSVIGMNFTQFWTNPQVSDGTADGFSSWTDSELAAGGPFRNTGTNVSLNGSADVRMTWNAANIWDAGEESNNEQALYRQYLDDGDGGGSLVDGDGIGVSVTITGLSAWLTSEGMISYEIRAYASSDADGATFRPVSVRGGISLGGTVLTTIVIPVLGDNEFPTGGFDQNWDPRGFGDSINTLTADSITLTIPTGNGSDIRGSLAAVKITAIPEPSTVLLGGFGILGLLHRRR
jgi:hypothetical protein